MGLVGCCRIRWKVSTGRSSVLWVHLEAKPTDLERYIYLVGLIGRNETCFNRAVMSDPARFIPILYDPDGGRSLPDFGPHLPPCTRHEHHARDEGPHMAEVPSQLAGARRALHLRLDRWTHPWSRRHRR